MPDQRLQSQETRKYNAKSQIPYYLLHKSTRYAAKRDLSILISALGSEQELNFNVFIQHADRKKGVEKYRHILQFGKIINVYFEIKTY